MLERFIVAAKECSQKDDNLETRCEQILFPLINEGLGYSLDSDSSEFVSRVIFGADKDEFMDYAIKDSNSEDKNTYILGIKIVTPGESFAEQRHVVERCLTMNPKTKYGVITDCINFEFYENVVDKNDSIGIKLASEIDLLSPTKNDDEFLKIFAKKGFKIDEDDSISEDDVFDNSDNNQVVEDEEEGPPIVIGDEKKPKTKTDAKKKKDAIKLPNIDIKKYAIPIIGAIVAIVLIWLLWSMFSGKSENGPDNAPGWNNQQDWSSINNVQSGTNTNSTMAYINLKAIVSTKRYSDDSVEASLLNTNIEDGAKIKFVFQCGTYSGSSYGVINKGECTSKFKIPAEWYDPQVTVIAYMRFDEDGEYAQDAKIKDKYGDSGELIIQQVGAPQYAVAYTTMTHENEAVIKYINDGIMNQQNEIKAKRDRDFAKCESLVDTKGNIKIVPEGFSLTKENITETRHIYPYIYYDAKANKSYFYIVAGYVSRDWINFRSVNIFADTYKWGYDNSSNQKEVQLGQKSVSEWIYFSNDTVLTLLNDMNLLAASNETSIRLSGPIKKDYVITQEEKDNLKFFLYLYETYFGNGTITPDAEWFNIKSDVIDLSYIKKATDIRMRNSEQILDMEKLQATVSEKRASGAAVSPEDITQLEQMGKTFKPVSTEIYEALHAAITTGSAYQVYDTDEEHGNHTYMKFYLFYDEDEGTIENGYIPYINIYQDRKVQIPIRSADNSSYTTKTMAELEISQELYNNIVTAQGREIYKYYGDNAVVETPDPEPGPSSSADPYEGFVFFGT